VSRQVLLLIIETCVPPGASMNLVINDTVERRGAARSAHKGMIETVLSPVENAS